MCDFYNNLVKICDDRGTTPYRAFIDAGIPASTLTEIKKGRTKSLSSKNLEKLSQFFDISVDEILGKKDPTTDGSETLQSLSFIIRNMSEDQRKALLVLLTSQAK